jgi:hypothetical protein
MHFAAAAQVLLRLNSGGHFMIRSWCIFSLQLAAVLLSRQNLFLYFNSATIKCFGG